MVILIILFVLAIFFPFVWALFFAYIAWLFFTKKVRRTALMRNAIASLIKSGQSETLLPNVYYEAAQKYAVDCGANISPYKNDPSNDSLIFDISVDGTSYSAYISKWQDGSTFLSIEKSLPETPKPKVVNFIDFSKFGNQESGELLSKSILRYVENKDQAQAACISLIAHAFSNYMYSFYEDGIPKVINNLDLTKYSIDFNNFYTGHINIFENIIEDKFDRDPLKNDGLKESGLDPFDFQRNFEYINHEVKDPEKNLEIYFFTVDSIVKKWNLH